MIEMIRFLMGFSITLLYYDVYFKDFCVDFEDDSGSYLLDEDNKTLHNYFKDKIEYI